MLQVQSSLLAMTHKNRFYEVFYSFNGTSLVEWHSKKTCLNIIKMLLTTASIPVIIEIKFSHQAYCLSFVIVTHSPHVSSEERNNLFKIPLLALVLLKPYPPSSFFSIGHLKKALNLQKYSVSAVLLPSCSASTWVAHSLFLHKSIG